MHNVTAGGGSVVLGDEVRASPVREEEQDGAGAGLGVLEKQLGLLGQDRCEADEEDVLGVVGEQEGVEAAGHTGLAQHLEKVALVMGQPNGHQAGR